MKKSVILFAFLSLLFVSCTNQEEGPGYEPYDTHPVWTDSTPEAFWDK